MNKVRIGTSDVGGVYHGGALAVLPESSNRVALQLRRQP